MRIVIRMTLQNGNPSSPHLAQERMNASGSIAKNVACPLHGHLNKVTWWLARFASEMFSPESSEAKSAWEWGYLTGLWHDLGKFAPDWQRYLRGKVDPHSDELSGKVDHSTAGALHSGSLILLSGIFRHIRSQVITQDFWMGYRTMPASPHGSLNWIFLIISHRFLRW